MVECINPSHSPFLPASLCSCSWSCEVAFLPTKSGIYFSLLIDGEMYSMAYFVHGTWMGIVHQLQIWTWPCVFPLTSSSLPLMPWEQAPGSPLVTGIGWKSCGADLGPSCSLGLSPLKPSFNQLNLKQLTGVWARINNYCCFKPLVYFLALL